MNNRKDVTPQKTSNGVLKKFGIGLLGGVLGGFLTIGGTYYATDGFNFQNEPLVTENTTTSGDAKVSNVKVDVNSDITSAISKVQNAVVSVINLQTPAQSQWGSPFEPQQNNSTELAPASEGSGVIYKKDGKDAYIVTNNHVVEGQKGLEILLQDGTKVQAELVGTDAYTDLAVLKISSDKVKSVATFGDSDALKVGEPAIAIGSPLGSDYANSVTQGIVSSLNRMVQNTNESGQEISINAIQTDAAINPGNSGGPLVNVAGQVIGINSSKIASSANSGVSVEGMGFAIPSNDVTSIIAQLEENGSVARPALGISMLNMNEISSQQQEKILKVPSSVVNGVVVRYVESATPAEKAGLQQYDVITKVDGKDVSNSTELRAALYKKQIGDKMELTFYREGKEQTVTVELTLDQSALNQQQPQQ
ncbi:S1C family serine protease [Candidatus Enterococcus willemsii]|uniref:Serine protease n=1 Tax=Candidatus Enterococcus willemsii TaxID=1857215 RepID=A0ABQ6YW98_9ENTE|nr:trypsin-like peptidase domain-containing protein [Enterococcus sp. CU12B]KAF1301953.1 serine protease [Enterococcus sp. CU12B]